MPTTRGGEVSAPTAATPHDKAGEWSVAQDTGVSRGSREKGAGERFLFIPGSLHPHMSRRHLQAFTQYGYAAK